MKTLDQHNYFGIDATIIADSTYQSGGRLTTFVVTFPRIVLAEFNTHRVFSRNSASSRAVPFKKMVERVKEHPFIPMSWMKDHSGMQGTEYFKDEDTVSKLTTNWLRARDKAVEYAEYLSELGLTKQICNRPLETYMWHTAIVTSEDFENFFALRADGPAEIHIQHLAYLMLEQYLLSTPKMLQEGQWHIPFGENIDEFKLARVVDFDTYAHFDKDIISKEEMFKIINIDMAKVRVATARCARVSYINFEGKDDYEADLKLYDRMSSRNHWSPFEHCAQVPSEAVQTNQMVMDKLSGNFKTFIQLRKLFEGENQTDPRVHVQRGE